MSEFKCEECSKHFLSKDALDMHNDSKHYVAKKKPVNTKKMRNQLIVVVIIALLGWGVFALFQGSTSCIDTLAEELNIGGHNNLALHVHSNLRVIIDEVPQIISSEIGIGPGLMRPIHTHDGSGRLHIEAPCQKNLLLGDFFKIWGEDFDKEGFDVVLKVNDVENSALDNYVLRDGEELVLEYTKI